jgi:polyhydroxyalkanoate synthesis regulator phasin
MPEHRGSTKRDVRSSERSLAGQIVARTLEPLGAVMLTRDRIQETLEEAVQRGRVTRSDANELASELLRRGRAQTEELVSEIERVLEAGWDRLDIAGSPLGEGINRLAKTAERARRSVGAAGTFPISDYEGLTARQVQSRLGELNAAELTRLREYERRHANRKTVLDAIDRALR